MRNALRREALFVRTHADGRRKKAASSLVAVICRLAKVKVGAARIKKLLGERARSATALRSFAD